MNACAGTTGPGRKSARGQLARGVLAAVAIALASLPAHALRCDGGIVSVGDHEVVVRERCGEPARVDTRLVHPYNTTPYPGVDPLGGDAGRRVVRYLPLAIEVEEWVYDLGNRRFLQLLRFQGGRLIAIETLPKPR